ncbi:MAG: hypothetical protein OET79_04175, partial [Nitrospirota bacterium]|nr:hypothetical protein [Nitrospirota bacterium]
HAAIVPDDQIARPPHVGIDQLRLDDAGVEVFDQLPSGLDRHALNAPGVVAQKETWPPGLRVGADDRVVDRWLRLFLLLRHRVFAVTAGPGKVEIVDRAQRRQVLLRRVVQRFIGVVHADEPGFTTLVWHTLGIEQRGLTGAARPGTIGVPMDGAFVRVFAGGLAVLVQIGEIVDLGMAGGVILVHHMHLNRAETAGEHHLIAGLQILPTEQQELVLQERLVNPIEERVLHRRRQIDVDHLDPERRAQFPNPEWIGRAVNGP